MLAGACATGIPGRNNEPDASGGGPARPDGPTPDAPPSPPIDGPVAIPAGLLVSEVALAPTLGEFIEIVNPGDQAVDLTEYYLSDSPRYFQLPVGAPTVDPSDFIVQFPAGSSIAAHGVVTVSLDTAANFQTTYGAPPTFAIAGGTMLPIAMPTAATLTNGGEPIILFSWTRGDLVRDVDIIVVGAPSTTNALADKSGMAIDGPDADTLASTYAADARTITAQASTPGSGLSTKRIALEAGHEVQNGAGNGLAGDDETSEDTAQTWDTSFTAPTPGAVPASLLQ